MTPRNTKRPRTESPAMTTVSEKDRRVIRRHVDWLRRTGATERTRYHREASLRRLAQRLPCDLLDATPEDLDVWQSGLGVSNSSIGTYTSHTRDFYRWAHETGLLEHNPAVLLPTPKIPKRLPRPIPPNDVEVILTCATGNVRCWIVLGMYMGLRTGEIARICREDITEGIVGGQRRTFLSGIGKGEKPFRLVVPTYVLPVLQEHITSRPGPLWPRRDGKAMHPDTLTKEVTAFMRRLGMPYTQHWCRHTFGTNVQQQTKDLLETQVLMRHDSPNTTLLYVDPGETAGLAAADRLSASLRPQSESRRRKPPRSGRPTTGGSQPGQEAS